MLTVLIATRNGSYTLPRCLAALAQLISPVGGWKLVVVDNGSTDGANEIIESFADRLPLTCLSEPRPGKNAALNTGLQHMEGDLVVFTDDDTLPRPDWLVEMRRAANDHPSFSVFGGTVLPYWEAAPEPWITAWVQLGPVFTITNADWTEGPIWPGYVFGPNMAIRADLFREGHRLDPRIGPRAGQYPMGSETEFVLRLEKAGATAWHCKQATVEHIIRAFQMKRSWILGRARRYGRGKYRLYIHQENTRRKKILGVPGYLLYELRKKSFDVIRAQWKGDPAKIFERRWVFHFLLGQAIEAFALRKESQSEGRDLATEPSQHVSLPK